MRNCTDAEGELAKVPPGAPGPHRDGAKVARLTRILFVFSRESSFVAIDRGAARGALGGARLAAARAGREPAPLARAVARSDLVFGWFASWHTFWPVTLAWLMRKPSVVVIGGFDTARMPEIGYGLQQRRVMRHVSRWVMRQRNAAR